MFHLVHTALHTITAPVSPVVNAAKKLTGIISSTREDAH